METQSGFDLNTALATWRADLAGREGISPEAIRELESHLREGIAAWTTKGLTEAEAFAVAKGRLGSPVELAAQFCAENKRAVWRTRAFWMLVGTAGMNVLTHLSGLITGLTVRGVGELMGWDTFGFIMITSAVTAGWVVSLGVAARWILAGKADGVRYFRKWHSRWTLGLSVAALLIGFQTIAPLGLLALYSLANHSQVLVSAVSVNGGLIGTLYLICLAWLLARVAPDSLFEAEVE